MDEPGSLSRVAALLADPTRAEMLTILMDGRAFPVSDLAARTHVSVSTASHHLALLAEAGIVEVLAQGRHRYHRLANAQIAQTIEGMVNLARPIPVPVTPQQKPLLEARSCYNHLAGALGVRIRESLEHQKAIVVDRDQYLLTEEGCRLLECLEIDPLLSGRVCLDWTERLPHIGGKLGSAIFHSLLERGWIARSDVPRQIQVTTKGRVQIADLFPES